MKHLQHKRGFTLIEMLVYIAVLVLIAAVFVTSLASLVRTQSNIAMHRTVLRTTTMVTDRIVRDIRNADSVDEGASVLGISPGQLALVMDASDTVTYSLNNGVLEVAENGGAGSALTASAVSVTSLIFSKHTLGESEGVRVELTYTVDTGRASTTKSVTAFGVLRGSY